MKKNLSERERERESRVKTKAKNTSYRESLKEGKISTLRLIKGSKHSLAIGNTSLQSATFSS